jgi:N-formylglutamate amidohydrolase
MKSINSSEKDMLILKGFVEIPGEVPVLLTAPHAMGPKADRFTGEIAYRLAVETGAHALIATISREELDYNRANCRDTPFRKRIQEIIEDLLTTNSEVLLLDTHGMEKSIKSFEDEIMIIYGTAGGITIDVDYIEMFREELEEEGIIAEYAFMEAPQYIGGDIVVHHGKPSKGVHAVQIEIASKKRELGEHSRNLLEAFANFIRRWLLHQYRYELPKTQMRKLLKDVGAQRISHDAPEALRDILETALIRISAHAVTIGKTSNRTTVEGADIRKAALEIFKRRFY